MSEPDVQFAGSKIVDLALEVLRSYQLEHEVAVHTVRGLRSIFHGFASLEQRGGFDLSLDRDESFRLLIYTYLVGIKTTNQTERARRKNNKVRMQNRGKG